MKRNQLTEAKIRDLRPKEDASGPVDVLDGCGLYLRVYPSGRKTWRVKLRSLGSVRFFSLGVWPAVSLEAARRLARSTKENFRAGKLEQTDGRKAHGAPLLCDVAGEWLTVHLVSWMPGTYEANRRTLDADVLPFFPKGGAVRVSELNRRGIADVCRAILAERSPGQTWKAVSVLSAVLAHAVALGVIQENPASGVSALVPKVKRGHLALLAPSEIGPFLSRIGKSGSGLAVKSAGLLLPLTAVRPGELIRMQWEDVDFSAEGGPVWVHVAEKVHRVHKVPLSRQAVEILRILEETKAGPFVFPGRNPGEPLSRGALAFLFASCQAGKFTPHGWRATFRTHCAEFFGANPWALEEALSHTPPVSLGLTYARADYLNERREIMQTWADWIDLLMNGEAPEKAAEMLRRKSGTADLSGGLAVAPPELPKRRKGGPILLN